MNKAELIENIANATNMSKTESKEAVEAFINTVEKSLKGGNPVVLTGFGTFEVLQRKARTGINPATGEKMKIKAKRVPKFKPGKRLKDLVA